MTRARTPDEVPDLGAVLVVFAHPDDETYLAAGLLSAIADRGARVDVVTATAGERGTDRPDRWPPARLRATREWEVTGALATLGLHRHRVLGLDDGELARVPVDRGAAHIAVVLDEVRPDTIVTFGPDGITGHTDHRAVAAWVDLAARQLIHPPRVLGAALESEYCARFARLHDELSVFMDPTFPRPRPLEELALQVEMSGVWLDRKVVALRCQATQTAPIEAAVGEEMFRDWVAVESFVELRPGAESDRFGGRPAA
jgi:LmbE family N-acetylglucosaminyl deacetylase